MYADLILPLFLPQQTLTYSVPYELISDIAVGCSVVAVVKNKMYSAIVQKLYDDEPKPYLVKPIISIIDKNIVVNKYQLDFWKWIAEYYMCTIGEVMAAALPSGLRLQSKTHISLSNLCESEFEITEREAELYSIIEENKTITLQDLIKKSRKKTIITILKNMLEKGIICIDENIESKYKPRLETFVKLSKTIKNETELNKKIDFLKNAKMQEKLLIYYLSLSENFDFTNPPKIKKKQLLNDSQISAAALNECIKKQIFETENQQIGRLSTEDITTHKPYELSDAQETALNEINKSFETKNTVLLHGVTSSGKTEIYFKLIETQLQQGKQVLYLLPEIALTQQLLTRLQKVFGNKVGVFHSKYSENERVEVYNNIIGNKLLQQQYSIVIGARSAMFLPFANLGLIIVDEEHDASYKQHDVAPFYNARDAATFLAQLHGAKTILGSATPSIESYYNALRGKYGLARLSERFGDAMPPKVETVNIITAYKKKQMNGHFTAILLDAMFDSLRSNEQIILFQNRRGFAPYLQCENCGEIPNCKHCNVSLTYHKNTNNLRCHYCGYSENLHETCKNCGSEKLNKKGAGTEKIDEELKIIFPKTRTAIFDTDSLRTRNAYIRTISEFENHDTDILVGTQMISKGLDFGNVRIVGILNADNMLNFSDFRAHERAFQLMMQVGGRAGRRKKNGRVFIQTYNPENKTIRDVVDNNYENFFAREIAERKNFCYPPFYRLINITLKHYNVDILNNAAHATADSMRRFFGNNVLGPEYPTVNKIQNKFISAILLKIEQKTSLAQTKKTLQQCISQIQSQQQFKSVMILIDVDP
ncbi:MAG: primosomal protein N' [Prevotellaceae bacterium]|jgi:primosomal protein N' (replication factor Y)|nr:primosomal protein N' [Prevotellaceae bacterium]